MTAQGPCLRNNMEISFRIHAGIQSLLNELPTIIPSGEYDWDTLKELHVYTPAMFERHFRSQFTPSPSLHDGIVQTARSTTSPSIMWI